MSPVIRAEGDIEGSDARHAAARRIADDSFAFLRQFLRVSLVGALVVSLVSLVAAVAAPRHVAIATPAPPNDVVRPPPPGNGSFTVPDAGFVAAASGDYRRSTSSPLVDRGDSASIGAYIAAGDSATDLAGLPRIAGAAAEVGAYETVSAGVTDVTSQVALRLKGFVFDRASRRYTQVVTLANSSGGVLTGPISLVFDALSAGVTVAGMTNVTVNRAPGGSPTSTSRRPIWFPVHF